MPVPHYAMFIDGEWVDSLERYEIRSPATDELVATVAKADTSHVDRAVAAAKAAHRSGVWRNKPPEERAEILDEFYGAYEAEVALEPDGHRMDYVHCVMEISKAG